MRRRTLLAGGVGLVAGLAGCSGVLSGSGDSNGGGNEGPAETVRSFYETAFDGDLDGANAYIHSESDVDQLTQSDLDGFQSVDARLESVEVVEQSGDAATVQVRLSAVPEGSSERQTLPPIRLELRKADGEWKLYDDGASGGPSAPSVQWDSSERTDADGSVTAVVFEHAGGDTVPSGTLTARAEGSSAATPGGSDVTAGTSLVVPMDGRGNSVAASTEIALVWSDPDGETSQILATHTLSSPAVGTLGETLFIE